MILLQFQRLLFVLQLDFSKQELRKVIAIYPGREVKKGLDNLYKKVERHLCEEENLIQV